MILEELSEDIFIKVRKKPFRHIVIENLFKRDTYRKLCKDFDERIGRGFENKFSEDKFWKFNHYDAYCYGIDAEKDISFGNIVYDPGWKRFINGFFQHQLTNHVMAELHHHKTGSESGYIHNDYDMSSFINEPLPNGTNPHRNQCVYRGRSKGAEHCVRSIAILYYFNNHKWYNDFGGETAFYDDFKEGSEPLKKIAPNSNKLVAFEISPKSYHSFLCNRMSTRNSLVMWFHCPEKWATQRYKEEPK